MSEMDQKIAEKEILRGKRSAWEPFLWTAIIWLILGAFFSAGNAVAWLWQAGLWALCLLDMGALAKATMAVFELTGTSPSNRNFLIIRTFYWGTIKLACLGLFGTILLKGGPIPHTSLFIGFGTMFVVPVVGGLWWHQREFSYAW